MKTLTVKQYKDWHKDATPEQFAAACDLIDLSHDLMNDDGAHWVQGAYHRMKSFLRGNQRVKESCYCMIGGLNAAGRQLKEGRVRGDLALAKRLVATAIARQEVRMVKYRSGMGYYQKSATDTIISTNDSMRTTWKDVNRYLRTASRMARTLAARRG